jgi:hypothetical protein
MPITYQIDAERRLIRTVAAGDVTLEEVLGHLRDVEADPGLPADANGLADLRECTSLLTTEQVVSIEPALRRLGGKMRLGACALVASRDALYGMLRMFEMLSESQFAAIRVFRRLDEAEAWLRSRDA